MLRLRSRVLALGALGASAAFSCAHHPPPRGVFLRRAIRMASSPPDNTWEPPAGFVDWKDDAPPPLEAWEEPRAKRSAALHPVPPVESIQMDAQLDAAVGVCMGCGASFQSDNNEAPGYVPQAVIEEKLAVANEEGKKRRRKSAVCQRCHGLRYQNRLSSDTLRVGTDAEHSMLQPDYFLSIVKNLGRTRCLIVLIVDLFDFHGSLMPQIGQESCKPLSPQQGRFSHASLALIDRFLGQAAP